MIAEILRMLALSTLASSAAIAAIMLLRKPLRRRFGAQVAYALWALVPLAAAVVFLPAPVASDAPMPTLVTTAPATLQALPLAGAAWPSFDPVPWLGALWVLGAAICAALFVRQQRRFLHALGHLSPGAQRTLRAQATAGCPALIGAWRPQIVLPADFEQRYDRTQRELILVHERAHMAQCDAQINALVATLRCLYWFNPLFHFAASRLRFDQELACDASVIARFPEARRSYADAMLKTQLADLGLPAGCHWQSSHPLRERIAMLKQPLPGRARTALGLGLVAALVVGGSYAAWAAQPAVPDGAMPQSIPAKPEPAPTANVSPRITEVSYRRLTRIEYPQSAIVANAQGVVYIAVHVGTDGKVIEAKVSSVMPLARTDLADAALTAVKSWTFEPRTVDGKAVASDTTVAIAFSLDPQKPPAVNPGVLDAIRVSPPQSDASPPSDQPPSEKVEYRRMHPPHYPASAIKAHEQGKVTLKVLVDAKGDPVEAKVAKTDPPDISSDLTDSAIAAVLQWKFNPSREHGKRVKGWALVPITYSLTEM